MAYIGKTPITGNFVKLDAISVVNGQAAYTMNNGGSAFTNYNNVNQFLVSLNGILQSPTTSFTVASSTITFASNLSTGDVIDFIIVLGNTLDVGVCSDNTVSTAKIVDGAITSAKLASGVGGKVLQVVTATDDTTRSTTSTSFVTASNTLSVSITPSSTSSKVLILVSSTGKCSGGSQGFFTVYRDSTNLGHSTNGFIRTTDGNVDVSVGLGINYLDSPNTTSAITYQVYVRASANTLSLQANTNRGVITAMEIGA